jgi:NAD(P)-dependent dehydrogenase (short-subunit alcohol dehydrogenase family)
MGVREDLTAAAGHVAGLRNAVTALSRDLGNTIDVQRLRDDVVRLADDIDLVARAAGIGAHDRAGGPGEIVFIPDEDYDPAMWADADDELGPHLGSNRA